jgi:hypothetical protein
MARLQWMTANIPFVFSQAMTEGLGAVPSVLEESQPEGMVDHSGVDVIAMAEMAVRSVSVLGVLLHY